MRLFNKAVRKHDLSFIIKKIQHPCDIAPRLAAQFKNTIAEVFTVRFPEKVAYFLKNPNPEYGLRFSYDLDPSLKGQQLLIQELSLLTSHLLEENAFGQEEDRNSRLYALLETGAHPPDSLSLADYLKALSELC